ncbi:hypothetical protein [Paenibacillus sp. IHB B 3415]|uniref:hypothetical protein n=1 Tax=Paenibacillus sp. IHB B 3415 TaxID=867080 RepID=UPI000AB9C971|nr:hypothetical protein [Paenibacillus sp. IHB B 3415]
MRLARRTGEAWDGSSGAARSRMFQQTGESEAGYGPCGFCRPGEAWAGSCHPGESMAGLAFQPFRPSES